MRPGLFAAAVCATALLAAQDNEAPPAIAQGGVVNFASHIAPQLPSGAIAPGSLIRIRGWRLGAAKPDEVIVRIRRGDTHVDSIPLAAGENEIEAVVPDNAPPGSATIQVIRKGQASLEWPVAIAAASFGAFSRNGLGWGPGEIANADGSPNAAQHPAKPGETVTLDGTGLGSERIRRAPQVLVAGMPATAVRVLVRDRARPGIDTLAFTLPPGVPQGCQVPIEVSSRPGVQSNAVTLAISRDGRRCQDRASWKAPAAGSGRLATVALAHAELELALTPRETSLHPIDAALVTFSAVDPESSANPLFLFPPVGTCTTYSGKAGLHAITSPVTILEALPGKPLDAGTTVTIHGGGDQVLPAHGASPGNYWRIVGGSPPVPGMHQMPLFFTPGPYTVTAPGGGAVGPFTTQVEVGRPVEWTNREEIAEVDRTRGATVTWQAASKGDMLLIAALNDDARSGAMGAGVCLADAATGSFHIPPYALSNIPPTPQHPRGFPLNMIVLLEFPPLRVAPTKTAGLDGVMAFAVSVSARSVRFR